MPDRSDYLEALDQNAATCALFPQARELLDTSNADLEKKTFVFGSSLTNLVVSTTVPALACLTTDSPVFWGAIAALASLALQGFCGTGRGKQNNYDGEMIGYAVRDVAFAQHKAKQSPSQKLLNCRALMGGIFNGFQHSTPSLLVTAPTHSIFNWGAQMLGLDRALTAAKVILCEILEIPHDNMKKCDAVDQMWGADKASQYAYFTPRSRDAAEASIVRTLRKRQIRSVQETKNCV